jgi:hypothetical protein
MSFTFFCLIKSGRKVNRDSDKLAPIHLDKDHTIPEYLDTNQSHDVTMDTVHRAEPQKNWMNKKVYSIQTHCICYVNKYTLKS